MAPYARTADQGIRAAKVSEFIGLGVPTVSYDYEVTANLRETGAGLLVPHCDPAAIAAALRSVMKRGDVMTKMAAAAAATAPQLLWPVVADQYRELAGRLIAASVPA